MKHKYETIAENSFYLVWCSSFNWRWKSSGLKLSSEDKKEAVREAVEAIIIASKKYPQHKDNYRYLLVVGKNRIIQFLFGSHHELKEKKGFLNPSGNQSYQGWMKQCLMGESSDFIEDNFYEIYEILIKIRNKKGTRGKEAALRDAKIIRLASLGWSNSEIGDELGIAPDNIKKYRQSIKKKLIELADK